MAQQLEHCIQNMELGIQHPELGRRLGAAKLEARRSRRRLRRRRATYRIRSENTQVAAVYVFPPPCAPCGRASVEPCDIIDTRCLVFMCWRPIHSFSYRVLHIVCRHVASRRVRCVVRAVRIPTATLLNARRGLPRTLSAPGALQRVGERVARRDIMYCMHVLQCPPSLEEPALRKSEPRRGVPCAAYTLLFPPLRDVS